MYQRLSCAHNAPKRIRTFTLLPEQRPERCASASSAIGASHQNTTMSISNLLENAKQIRQIC